MRSDRVGGHVQPLTTHELTRVMRFDRVVTPRLILRRWQPENLDPFAALNADPEVMKHFPSTYDRASAASMITSWEAKLDRQGFGLWAVERAGDGVLLGMAGLNPVPPGIIAGEGLEVGWRLARHAWGHGYATEAGRAAIGVARGIDARSIWSFTSTRPHVLHMLDLTASAPRVLLQNSR